MYQGKLEISLECVDFIHICVPNTCIHHKCIRTWRTQSYFMLVLCASDHRLLKNLKFHIISYFKANLQRNTEDIPLIPTFSGIFYLTLKTLVLFLFVLDLESGERPRKLPLVLVVRGWSQLVADRPSWMSKYNAFRVSEAWDRGTCTRTSSFSSVVSRLVGDGNKRSKELVAGREGVDKWTWWSARVKWAPALGRVFKPYHERLPHELLSLDFLHGQRGDRFYKS